MTMKQLLAGFPVLSLSLTQTNCGTAAGTHVPAALAQELRPQKLEM